jgi:hypothetical protein
VDLGALVATVLTVAVDRADPVVDEIGTEVAAVSAGTKIISIN